MNLKSHVPQFKLFKKKLKSQIESYYKTNLIALKISVITTELNNE